jgi:hypothetical protein
MSRSNNSGFALMQVLIAIPILAIITLVMTTLMSNLSRQMQVLSQKVEINQFENLMNQIFSNDTKCEQILDGTILTVAGATTTTPASPPTELDKLQQGSTGIVYVKKGELLPGSTSLKVKDIQLANVLKTGSTSEYQVTLTIHWDPTTMPMSLKPLQIEKLVTVDSSNKIISCQASSGGGGGGGGACSMVGGSATKSSSSSGCTTSGWKSAPCGTGGTVQQGTITCDCGTGKHPAFCLGTSTASAMKMGTSQNCGGSGPGSISGSKCSYTGKGSLSLTMSCCAD